MVTNPAMVRELPESAGAGALTRPPPPPLRRRLRLQDSKKVSQFHLPGSKQNLSRRNSGIPTQILYVSFFLFFFFLTFVSFLKHFILFLESKERKREREGEKCQRMAASHTPPPPGTWPATQACALTGNQTSDPSVTGRRSIQ